MYRYRLPFGLVQLVYQRGTVEFGERSKQGNTFFLKAAVMAWWSISADHRQPFVHHHAVIRQFRRQ